MLVIITTDRILPPQQVCQACLLADGEGRPRWQQGRLGCARMTIRSSQLDSPTTYECEMGFKLVDIAEN